LDETTIGGSLVDPRTITVFYNEDPPGSGKSEFYKRLIIGEPRR
jgi:hypothetical protein